MSTPYIPAKDADLDVWANNYSTVITASPATYGLAAADATAISTAFTTWHAAYLLAVNPSTKTSTTVAAKDVQKASALIVWRTYANLIQANQAVTAGAKAAAGLTIRSTARAPIPAPATAPVLTFVGATPGEHTLQYRDTTTPTTKKKPFGAIALELYQTIAVAATTDPNAAIFVGLTTKTPFANSFTSGDAGKVCTYWGRWVNRRGEVGPWSIAMHATIPSA